MRFTQVLSVSAHVGPPIHVRRGPRTGGRSACRPGAGCGCPETDRVARARRGGRLACWEVGAGRGSVARWLSGVVGSEGPVLATDPDDQWFDSAATNTAYGSELMFDLRMIGLGELRGHQYRRLAPRGAN